MRGARRSTLTLIAMGLALGAGIPTVHAQESLVVAMPTIGSDILHYAAIRKDIFKQRGVNVTMLDNTGANTASLVVSGQADIALFAATVPLIIAGQGKETSIIYGIGGAGIGGSVVGDGKKVNSMEDLKTANPCRIATFPAGSVAYGFAALFKDNLKLNCELIPFSDPPSQLGALLSGRAEAIVGSYTNFATTVADGKAKLIMDSRDPEQRRKYIGPEFPEAVMFGLTDKLKAKSDAVVRYLKGLDDTYKLLKGSTDAQMADILTGTPALAGRSKQQLQSDVASIRHYVTKGSTDGYIAKSQWDIGLQRYALWGVPGFNSALPRNAYDARVDMSYYVKAIGKPPGN